MTKRLKAAAGWVGICAVAMTLGLATTTAAVAQEKAQEKKAAAKKSQNPWVKLCLDEPGIKKGEDGKIQQVKRKSCYTMTERLDINTGLVLSAIKLREVEGVEKKALIVTVPLGMALAPGLRVLVYSGPQWKKAIAKEKVDEKKLKELKFTYLSCDVIGCDAGIEATKDIIDALKKGAGVNILALNTQGRIFSSPMPLKGFTDAHKGKPVDNKKYAQARQQLMAQIQKRRQDQIAAKRAAAELEKEKKEIDQRRKEKEKK